MQFLRSIVKLNKPDCVFLMETKANEQHMERIRRTLGFAYGWHIGAKGIAGVLSLLWNEEISLTNIWNMDRIIGGIVLSIDRGNM